MSSPPPLFPEGGGRSRHPQVSLRGASAREISRDALLHKVSKEREVRSYARRAAAAALFIQRVWRRFHAIKLAARQYQEEWENNTDNQNFTKSTIWISNNLLRPFLFFTTPGTISHQKLRVRDIKCTRICFEVVLQSIKSPDLDKNFCCMAAGSLSDRATWFYQTQKLASLCLFLLTKCNSTCHMHEDVVSVTALGMRLLISFTDLKSWKGIRKENVEHCGQMIKKLLMYMATGRIPLYSSIHKYISDHVKSNSLNDDNFLITSAVTLLLRPFHAKRLGVFDLGDFELTAAAEEYCKFILTIPCLLQRLPSVLLRALRHESSLLPCLKVLLVSREKILAGILKAESGDGAKVIEGIPCIGWALSNVINLSTEYNIHSSDSGKFIQGLDYQLYVRAIGCLSEKFLDWVENAPFDKRTGEIESRSSSLSKRVSTDMEAKTIPFEAEKVSLADQLVPVHQQWHLRLLLNAVENHNAKEDPKTITTSGNLQLLDIVFFYANILRIHHFLNPLVGCVPLLNMLAFTPGFLPVLWQELEGCIFGVSFGDSKIFRNTISNHHNHTDHLLDKKMKGVLRDAGDKWVNALQKITGRPSDIEYSASNDDPLNMDLVGDENSSFWPIKSLGHGLQCFPREISHLLHLFCATYAHLLLVLDDIEFYEKQVPFTLVQQQKISNMLNSLIYSSFANSDKKSRTLIDVAVRCLNQLYERDCRHKFCPSSLWLEPAKKNRLPIAAAVRAHEAASANLYSGDTSKINSIITTMPHVFPFEERVQMFREFIKLDKASRRVAGEAVGPGLGSINIVIRRNHIVEDGFRQLNSLGSRLKSCFNVSFVSACDLPEVGLDCGGLSKEFLTDLSKSAFDPKYGLFVQTCTVERLLFPNISAKFMDNGLDLIEFLGRIVGKALYEGILLDFSFSQAFIQKLLGRYSYLDELSTLDPELYKNLMYVKHYDGNIEELSLDFTVTEEICKKRITTELKPNGRNIMVTNDNKLQYIYAIADYKLNRQILPLANAFIRGLSDLIAPSWLRLFNGNEFNQLLSGGRHDIDIEDLKKNTKYTGGYSAESRTIKLFWEVVRGFTPENRCLLLKFVTSCSRGPLLGFEYLQPSFTIHKVVCDVPLWALIGGQDVDRLPSASTCNNTLKLPTYKKTSTIRNKLLYAITSNAGFELS